MATLGEYFTNFMCGQTPPIANYDPNSVCGQYWDSLNVSMPNFNVAAPGVPEGALTQPYQPTSQAVQQSQDVAVAQTQENMQAYVNAQNLSDVTSIFQSSWLPWVAIGAVVFLLWEKR